MKDRIILSSRNTYFLKFIMPVVVQVPCAFYLVVILIVMTEFEPWILFAPGIMIGTWLLMRNFIRLKHVSVDDHNFYISNFSQEIRVPRTQQIRVEQISYMPLELIRMSFDMDTDFGREIIFSPKYRFTIFYTASKHPVMKELDPFNGRKI